MGIITRYIGLVMTLVVFLAASRLQYAHDISHDTHHNHHYCSSVDQQPHADHPGEDECALCWFLSHQVSLLFVWNPLLPEAAVNEVVDSSNARYLLFYLDGKERSQSNKDPPRYHYHFS